MSQKKQFKKQPSGDLFLYGRHPVTLALNNKRRVIKEILIVKTALDKISIPKNIPVRIVDRSQIDVLVGKDAVHQGIVARTAQQDAYAIEDLINDTVQDKTALVVMLDQVTDPHNIGAILRSAAAFNAKAVIIPETGAPEETGVLAKSASGALELIPLIRVSNLVRGMQLLQKHGFWCIGLDGYAQNTVFDTNLPKKCAIIMGSEGEGMRRLTSDTCDDTIKLPMNPNVESLNVSNACAVTLYEWNRQHHGEKLA